MNKAALGFRWGQLISGLEAARGSLELAKRAADLLPPDDRARLAHAAELLASIEQRAWETKDHAP